MAASTASRSQSHAKLSDAELVRAAARYSDKQLVAARDKLMAKRASLPGPVVSAGPEGDGSGLEVGVDTGPPGPVPLRG